MKTGTANLPLHYGAAPRWLFERMVRLAREIAIIMVEEYGTQGFLQRLADPFWFQAFGCVLGFDWHSSGLTTTTCGALKEGLRPVARELGLFVAGGKGKTSRRTPQEIEAFAPFLQISPEPLVYASKMAAKVDNTAVQDGYQLYHHVLVFDRDGHWAVIQQGMNPLNRYARRYHWLGDTLEDFCCEPHSAVCCDIRQPTLNMVALESDQARQATTEVAKLPPEKVLQEVEHLRELELPARHAVQLQDISTRYLKRVLLQTYERQPENFETLLGLRGVGPATIRALSLVAELMYGAEPSFRDPARFSFAHGGKDGTPYPVNRANYDRTIYLLRTAIARAKIGQRDRLEALKRLARLEEDSNHATHPMGSKTRSPAPR
ncbi:MAG: DUF763 domain-containing protein [Anaerolineae bacterium]|nr:DUF763 domain-containing protein [Anaerolineae bacterium]